MTGKTNEIHYEFGGPVGAFGVIVGLPVVIAGLYLICNADTCLENPFTFDYGNWVNNLPGWEKFITREAVVMFLGWMAFHVILERVLPGENVEGVALPDKTRLTYTMSGHLQFWLTFILMGHAYPILGAISTSANVVTWLPAEFNSVYNLKGFAPLPLTMIYDHYLPLITVSVIFSFVMSLYL